MRGMLFAVALLTSLVGSAQASTVTYSLSLTPQAGSSLSGSGSLTITDGPVNPSGLFNVPVADISTLSISIGGFNFNLLGNISALQFTNGALSDITAADAIGAAGIRAGASARLLV